MTRPSIWDCMVKGIGRCELWFIKPQFDTTPRGERDMPLYSSLPVGWVALDESGLNARGDVSLPLEKLLRAHPDIEQQIWNAIGMSIDGQVPGKDWSWRWRTVEANDEDKGEQTFLLEIELPPATWFEIARHNGAENTTWASRRYRELLEPAECDDWLPAGF